MSVNTSVQTPGPSGIKLITRQELFDIMQTHKDKNISQKLECLEQFLLNQQNYTEEERQAFKRKISHTKSQFKRRWLSARYKEDLFKKQNEKWLQGTMEILTSQSRQSQSTKSFTDLSERSKRRRTEDLRENTSVEKLIFATQSKLRTSGLVDASVVLKEMVKSPKRATKYRKIYSSNVQKEEKQLSNMQALSLFVEARLSREQYNIIRMSDKKLFPCYSLLQKAKKDCYPVREAYIVTENHAEVNLQDVLNHTATRLLLYLKEVVNNLSDSDTSSLQLISKWGCDGSQQTQYKQRFLISTGSDSHIFQSSFVPLQLISSTTKKVIWQNPTPSSPRYCRPIRIRFIKESVDVTNEEIDYMKTKINELKETEIEGNTNISIKHVLLFTMIDGKVCNAAMSINSTMKCFVCGITSKDFNNLTKKPIVNPNSLQFGLSILHAKIRLFENLLHISYKLTIKKWQIKSKDEKYAVEQRKKYIQEEFKTKMGIIIDRPKPGFGNSNDGNTSRRFFANHELSAEITGIDVTLIYQFKIILQVISSNQKINIEKFEAYAMDTAKLYIRLYPWHPMTPTTHKILIHGPVIIENAMLPIGQLSEEAAEARNKHFRIYRENYSRKFSREACNEDVINRLLLTSDPYLTSIRKTPQKRTQPFLKETIKGLAV
uniref:uncharacterized protein LOC117606105 n=1 Tax=Osmia lignaria TaxID=473952 RepID=UPI00147806A7|nr:uncharacterized protein LOC117606105 [Osmia lignaria]